MLDDGAYILTNQHSAIQEVSSYQEEDEIQSQFKASSDDLLMKIKGFDSLKLGDGTEDRDSRGNNN